METTPKETGTLKVGEIGLYYEKRGHGPVLLLIPAGEGDADSYEAAAGDLAAWYTVLTYHLRGYGHSKMADAAEAPSVQDHADDAHSLLDMMGPEPAFVFGSGVGGVVALEMFSQYTAEIKAMVVHEPAKLIATDDETPETDLGEARSDDAEALKNYDYDLDALRASASIIPIVVAASSSAQATLGRRGAESAARFFDTPIADLPDHRHSPKTFAERLHELIADRAV